tara:strand:+ start:1558 stop:2727 length:1170 start_codon:yes stop_codon:yes gene_type:complete
MINHPLMENNITKSDTNALINFLKKRKKLTQSENVLKFEKEWSKWLGVKYSVFVNSGSSANLLTVSALKFIKTKGNEIILPALTWSSDINSVIHNGFKPVFVDINPKTLSMNTEQIIKKISKKTAAIFITHAQGFNGLSKKLLELVKKNKIILLEDVCESHGAKYKKRKLGSYGLMSNFSFYYAHHMTTVEGGMVCTNDKKLYEIIRSLRSHGLLREMSNKKIVNEYSKKFPKLSKEFIFLYPGYNVRNTELGAVMGRNQLPKLNSNIKKRNNNFLFFLKNLDNKIYQTDFDLEGISNYAFPLILRKSNYILRNRLEKMMKKNKIEFRRGNAGGGNQLRQPYIAKYIKKINMKNFKNVEHIHNFGYYIGNYPSLKKHKIIKVCKALNKI